MCISNTGYSENARGIIAHILRERNTQDIPNTHAHRHTLTQRHTDRHSGEDTQTSFLPQQKETLLN